MNPPRQGYYWGNGDFHLSATLLLAGGAVLFCTAISPMIGLPILEFGWGLAIALLWAVVAVALALLTRRNSKKYLRLLSMLWLALAIVWLFASGTVSITDILLRRFSQG